MKTVHVEVDMVQDPNNGKTYFVSPETVETDVWFWKSLTDEEELEYRRWVHEEKPLEINPCWHPAVQDEYLLVYNPRMKKA